MDSHMGAVNIFIAEVADLANTETRGIHDSNHSFLLDIWNCVDNWG